MAMTPIKWDEVMVGAVRKMVRRGATLEEIVKFVGTAERPCLDRMRHYGIAFHKSVRKRGPMTDEQKAQRREGMARYYERQKRDENNVS